MRELHIHTSALVLEAAEAVVIVIERHAEPVAELRPISDTLLMPEGAKCQSFYWMQEFWSRMPQVGKRTK